MVLLAFDQFKHICHKLDLEQSAVRLMMRTISWLLALFIATPALAADGYVEALQDGEPLCLIGSVNGQTITSLGDLETAPAALGPAQWMLATLDGLGATAEGAAPALADCGCLQIPQVALTPATAMTGSAIASNLPLGSASKLERLSPDNPAYVKAARSWLDKQGLELAPVRLTHILRTDLEGDGVDEVILAGAYNAMAVENADLSVGRYAFLLLRKVVGGSVVTTVVLSSVDPEPQDYEGSFMNGLTAIEPVAVVDVNGDGVAEVVASVWMHEGLSFDLYRLDGNELAAAASCGCGC